MTIPASQVVTINPGVVNAGGSGLVLNGLFLTESLLMPTGKVLSFAPGPAGNFEQNVASFFGIGSTEALKAKRYFQGYAGSLLTPSAMMFAAYNAAARAAFLNSGPGLTLAAVTALAAGTLTLTVDGTPITSASIDLSGATSLSNAAALIEAGFTAPGFSVAWNATIGAFVFTDTSTGATSTLTYCTTNALATGLKLTQAAGALLSQGAVADTPATAMDNAIASSQNWSTMVTLFEPDLADKQAFASWFNASNQAYLWLAWDSDATASQSPSGNGSFGALALAAKYDGVACIGGDPLAVPAGSTLADMVLDVAVFVASAIASINFQATNGRATMAFKSQSDLLPTCLDSQTSQNLLANGYSFYGGYATRNQDFEFFYDSNMPGEFGWIDTYIDDVWMNDQFQVTLLSLLTAIGSAAYNPSGFGLIRAALEHGPIAAALNFGAIRTGVTLSALQIQEVNQQAGLAIDGILSTQGYFLQILDPGATVRQERGSPIVNFWYCDGGSIQKITMSSLDIL